MTQKHTPTPWIATTFVDNRPHGSDHHTFKITPQRGPYGTLFGPDAAHIVKCVNMHDELVEALNMARLFIDGEYRDPSSELDGEILSREARSIHKVLCGVIAKAGAL